MLDAVSPFGVVRYSSLYNGNRKKTDRKIQRRRYESYKELEQRSGSLYTISEETKLKESPKLEFTLENCTSPLSQEQLSKKEEKETQFMETQQRGNICPQRTTKGYSDWSEQLEQKTPVSQTTMNLVLQTVDGTGNQSKDNRGDSERQEPLSLFTNCQEWLLLSKIKSMVYDFLLCYIEGVTLRPETIQMIRKRYGSSNGKETNMKKKSK
ncbi:hypothetical protein GpartN1_g7045.t1 [Galdieria partita]|uniref:Uncharacterized protein n=1 Tax=Galdieria partita TaxID=83374 RepID=A0A9C7Q2P9_9RHOD|nr:hypothetical protein GpartN1_g6451.t1 [Galdieria partita]GJQ15254.1 hypothetical protein GpartN1_g7045.t1 [Galdieria partita]